MDNITDLINSYNSPKKEYENDVDFFTPSKVPVGTYHFRVYRLTRDEVQVLQEKRVVYFRGRGKFPVEEGSPEALEIEAQRERLLATGDEEAVKKANDMASQPQFATVIRLREDDKNWKVWDQSPNQARQTLVAIASLGGWGAGWPWPEETSEDDMKAFGAALTKGQEMACGPNGIDLTLVKTGGKKTSYEIKVSPSDLMGERKVLDVTEAETPDPIAFRARIADAVAKKNAK